MSSIPYVPAFSGRKALFTRLGMLLLLASCCLAQSVLSTGDTVPDFVLTSHQGKATSFRSLQGKVVLLTFLYTKCPDPTMCPMTASKLSQLRQMADNLGPEGRDKVVLVAISLDPKKDTPEVLRSYASRFKGSPGGYLFLTGDARTIARVANAFGVMYFEENGKIAHNLRTYLIGADQRIVWSASDNDWKPEDLLGRIRSQLR